MSRRLAKFLNSNFKQPRLRILAAQCVRGLPETPPPANRAGAMERWEAPGCLRGTLGGGINVPTSRGKATARAQGKAQRLPALHRPIHRPFRGAPARPALALSAEGSPLESAPSSDRTRAG